MSRNHEYLNKPPEGFRDDVEAMKRMELFLVSTQGPTVFVIKQSETEKPFKVYIGDNQRCSCGGGEGRGKLCAHLLYVMVKVLRVPETNPLSWQLSLVDSEVTNILAGRIGTTSRRNNRPARPHAFLRRGSRSEAKPQGSDERPPTRKRKELEEEDVCPICQEYMTEEELEADALCFCQDSCGSNFHTRCLRMYATHLRSEKKKVLCPMCRGEWGELPSEPGEKGVNDAVAQQTSCLFFFF